MTVQSEAQATLTKQLINKIGMFNDTQKGSGETFGLQSLVNIRNLSVELEDHVSISRVFIRLFGSNLIRLLSFLTFITFKYFSLTIFVLH